MHNIRLNQVTLAAKDMAASVLFYIEDPSGNRIRIYTAGKNRRFPPWRVGLEPTQ